MPKVQPNLGRRGRVARCISGVFLLAAAAILLIDGVSLPGPWFRWVFLAVLIFVGGFQIFEALAGWCVARALGFRTPL